MTAGATVLRLFFHLILFKLLVMNGFEKIKNKKIQEKILACCDVLSNIQRITRL